MEDISEEESKALDNDPEFHKKFREMTQEAKERQLKLREAEQNSKQSKKET